MRKSILTPAVSAGVIFLLLLFAIVRFSAVEN